MVFTISPPVLTPSAKLIFFCSTGFSKLRDDQIKLIDSKLVDLDTLEGKEEFKKFNELSIVEGYEGIMIKDPNSFYECKRSTSE